jgi:hypothetical protein
MLNAMISDEGRLGLAFLFCRPVDELFFLGGIIRLMCMTASPVPQFDENIS